MKTPKRDLNPAITRQREIHEQINKSLKARIKHLENENQALRDETELLLRKIENLHARLSLAKSDNKVY